MPIKPAAIFVHSRYPKSQLKFYKKLCQGKYKVAVDGGYNFFRLAKIEPDIIIGDFDSLNRSSAKRIKSLSFPKQKDFTDTELAVKHCIELRFNVIDIVVPAIGEPDHFLGLVALLQIPELSWQKKYKVAARIINHKCEIMLLINRDITFADCNGEMISIIPFGAPVKLNIMGMDYPAEDLLIKPWQTKGMRNIIRSKNSRIAVKGSAIVVHYWNKNS